jgi:hypothetical protein
MEDLMRSTGLRPPPGRLSSLLPPAPSWRLVYQCISHALRLSWRIPALKGELSTAGTGCLYRALFASRFCSRFLILQVAVSTSFQPAFHGPNSATQDG